MPHAPLAAINQRLTVQLEVSPGACAAASGGSRRVGEARDRQSGSRLACEHLRALGGGAVSAGESAQADGGGENRMHASVVSEI